jgi:TPR repeat protein
MFETGLYARRDYAEALKWYRQAADQGSARAQFNVGRFHSQGHGVAVDQVEAIKWFRLAADQNDSKALFSLPCVMTMALARCRIRARR